VSRFTALKLEYEQLKSSYGNLSTVYERLKHGSASEVSKLLEQIRSENGIPGLLEDKSVLRRSVDDPQLEDHKTGPVDEHERLQPGPYASLGKETLSLPNPTPELFAMSQWAEPVDPTLHGELGGSRDFPPSPTALFQHLDLDEFRTSKDSRSHISVSHKVLLWPEVVRHIKETGIAAVAAEAISDLQAILKSGSPWLLQRETSEHRVKLPCNVTLTCSTTSTGSVSFPGLTIQKVDEYTSAYFRTFNMLLPLLDLDLFMDGVVARLLREGYRDDDPESVLALLVFALGQLAIEGVTGRPTRETKDESSGFRGGTIEKPPGLGLFNEARRRIGMINTQPCLENVQIMLLQATYFEASARHLDFWSSTSTASLACTFLIKSQQIDWTSSYGDLVKRAYWICVLQERLFDLEFRVVSTDIEGLEDQVPLPHFHGTVKREGQPGEPQSDTSRAFVADKHDDSAFHFIAMITLSRLIRRADGVIHGYEHNAGETELLWQGSDTKTPVDTSAYFPYLEGYNGPPSRLVSELFHQLDCWREALPQRLQWSDDDRFDFEEVESLTTALHNSFFSPVRNLGPGEIDHNVDIAVAQLRTRFYHARFLICRPFIYKALHVPMLMTADDRKKCALAIDAACLWPLSLAPPKNKKHLVPHLFSWTQNFLAMMFVLRMCQKSEYLGDICRENGIAGGDIESATSSMVQWLEDVRQVDGIADWSMRVLGLAFSTQ
jgi:hypothetical protein